MILDCPVGLDTITRVCTNGRGRQKREPERWRHRRTQPHTAGFETEKVPTSQGKWERPQQLEEARE